MSDEQPAPTPEPDPQREQPSETAQMAPERLAVVQAKLRERQVKVTKRFGQRRG